MFKVFYSWQSDLPGRTNRSLIGKALEIACKDITSENGIELDVAVDRDTMNVPGSPNIAEVVFSKIADADAFVADVSLINQRPSQVPHEDWKRHLRVALDRWAAARLQSRGAPLPRATPNPNVLTELGYAMALLGREAVILLVNTHFGGLEELPFDLNQLRTLTYRADPADSDRATIRNDLRRSLEKAILDIAGSARSDPAYEIIYPRTLQVAGQCDGFLRDLVKASEMTYDENTITEVELHSVCSRVNPNSQAPLITGGNAALGYQYANWLILMRHWRERSRNFTTDILIFNSILKREHLALLAHIEQCSYFAQLESLGSGPIGNTSMEWISSSIWDYVQLVRRLKAYAGKVLARRARNL